MKLTIYSIVLFMLLSSCSESTKYDGKVFDTHVHFSEDSQKQLDDFKNLKIVKAAVSSSWDKQEIYRAESGTDFLIGLMFPCPNGIVPYSGQTCFSDGSEFPDTAWVRQQLAEGKIDFLGEVLNEYYGVSPADERLFPYYALAAEFNIPVGIHTGLAGPGHLSPNYNPEMGDPALMKAVLNRYPGLKIWIMHAGAPYLKGTLEILKSYPQVYADISVLANPDIVPQEDFHAYMKSLVEAGFEDRLMFGSDNGNLNKMIEAVNELDFISLEQKEKIFYTNAVTFFGKD